VHNEVNRSLEKEVFDCSHIGDFYDCGCADEEGRKVEKAKEKETGAIEVEVQREG
jgi:FAD-linked sulfhydryl oxidase